MGKGVIKSSKGAGLYEIDLIYDTAAYQRREEVLFTQKTAAEEKITALEEQIRAIKYQQLLAHGGLNLAIEAGNTEEMKGATNELRKLKITLQILTMELSWEKARRVTAELSLEDLYRTPPTPRTLEAWCADLSEDLSGEVGTIEIAGEEEKGVLVVPGYDGTAGYDPDRDGMLKMVAHCGPAEAVYATAWLPGWQRWKPTYRTGIISQLDGDTCTVDLDVTQSSAQKLFVNPEDGSVAARIVYMECNGGAFAVGDHVIVLLQGQDWNDAVVIGFVSNPKACNVGRFGLRFSYTVGEVLTFFEIYRCGSQWKRDNAPPARLPGGRIWNGYGVTVATFDRSGSNILSSGEIIYTSKNEGGVYYLFFAAWLSADKTELYALATRYDPAPEAHPNHFQDNILTRFDATVRADGSISKVTNFADLGRPENVHPNDASNVFTSPRAGMQSRGQDNLYELPAFNRIPRPRIVSTQDVQEVPFVRTLTSQAYSIVGGDYQLETTTTVHEYSLRDPYYAQVTYSYFAGFDEDYHPENVHPEPGFTPDLPPFPEIGTTIFKETFVEIAGVKILFDRLNLVADFYDVVTADQWTGHSHYVWYWEAYIDEDGVYHPGRYSASIDWTYVRSQSYKESYTTAERIKTNRIIRLAGEIFAFSRTQTTATWNPGTEDYTVDESSWVDLYRYDGGAFSLFHSTPPESPSYNPHTVSGLGVEDHAAPWGTFYGGNPSVPINEVNYDMENPLPVNVIVYRETTSLGNDWLESRPLYLQGGEIALAAKFPDGSQFDPAIDALLTAEEKVLATSNSLNFDYIGIKE